MAQENKALKFEGKTTADLLNLKAEQVWPFLEDFCGIHKLAPILEKCDQTEGVYGKPGLVRYCVLKAQPSSPDSDKQIPSKWVYEKLLSMDPIKRSMTYTITDNNLGFMFYVADMQVIDIDQGCRIEWPYTAFLDHTWNLGNFDDFRNFMLKMMVENITKYIQTSIGEKVDKELKPNMPGIMEKDVQAVTN